MVGRVELFIGRGYNGDEGIARLDEHTRDYLNLKPGDEVTISSLALSFAETKAKVAEALIDDEGKSIIRIADDIMHEGNFKIGMRVLVGNNSPM